MRLSTDDVYFHVAPPVFSRLENRTFAKAVFSGMENARKLVDCRRNALKTLSYEGQDGVNVEARSQVTISPLGLRTLEKSM